MAFLRVSHLPFSVQWESRSRFPLLGSSITSYLYFSPCAAIPRPCVISGSCYPSAELWCSSSGTQLEMHMFTLCFGPSLQRKANIWAPLFRHFGISLWIIVLWLLSSSKYIHSFLTTSMTHELSRCVLFHFQNFRDFPEILLVLTLKEILLWSKNVISSTSF